MDKRTESGGGKRPFFRRRWPWAALSIIVVLVASLLALPLVLRHMVEGRLVGLGAEEAEIEDLGFNPFTGRVTIEGLRVRRSGLDTLLLPEASVRIGLLRLIKKELHLKSLTVKGADVSVEMTAEGVLLVGGIRTGAGGFLREWGVEVDRVELTSSEVLVDVRGFKGTVEADALELSGLSNTAPEAAGRLRLEGRLNGAPLDIDARLTPFSPTPVISARLRLSGFSIESLPLPASVASYGGTLNLDAGIEAEKGADGWSLALGEGAVDIKGLKAASSSMDVSLEALGWDGAVKLIGAAPGKVRLEADGAMKGSIASLSLPARELFIENSGFDWKGGGSYERSEGARSVGLKGEIKAGEAAVEGRGQNILGFKALGLDVEAEEAGKLIEMGSISIEGFFAGRPSAAEDRRTGKPLLSSRRVEARKASVAGMKRFSIGSVEFVELAASLEVGPEGRLTLPWKKTPGKRAPGGRGPEIGIAELKVSGRSRLEFKDGSITPAYRATLEIEELLVRNFDTTGSSPESPFTFRGKVDKYTKVNFNGKLNARAPRLTMESSGRVEAFDLPTLSAYSVRETGYNIKSGHLDADITMKITEGKMEGEGDLLVKNLDISPADKERIEKIKTELTMPLDAVVGLLKDRNDNISVKIPITGDIRDPDFKLGHVINLALMRASKKAAFSYLKYYFQPYGTFITIGQVVGRVAGEAIRVRLDPVFFAPGSVEPDSSALEYLGKVAGLMLDRPGIEVNLCGHSNVAEALLLTGAEGPGRRPGPKEVPEGTEALAELARNRAAFIKNHLVEEYGIEPERLFICNPAVDEDPKETPRVELLI